MYSESWLAVWPVKNLCLRSFKEKYSVFLEPTFKNRKEQFAHEMPKPVKTSGNYYGFKHFNFIKTIWMSQFFLQHIWRCSLRPAFNIEVSAIRFPKVRLLIVSFG